MNLSGILFVKKLPQSLLIEIETIILTNYGMHGKSTTHTGCTN